MRIRNPQHLLKLDHLTMAEPHPNPDPAGFWFEAQGRDFNLGNPVPVEVVLSSLMQDGSLVRIVSYNNREVGFYVTICGPDDKALALGAQALHLVLQTAREMTWKPPSGVGATATFDVIVGWMDYYSDDDDMMNLRRTYKVTLRCLPFTRSRTLTSTTFTMSSTPAFTTLDNCSSLSGWTTSGGVSLALETIGGDTGIRATGGGGAYRSCGLRRTSTNLGSQPYFAVDVYSGGYSPGYDALFINGKEVPVVGGAVSPVGPDWYRMFYPRPAVGGAIDIRWSNWSGSTNPLIGGVYTATSAPNSGVAVLAVKGSARTAGTFTWTPGSSYGVLYTDPTMITNGWNPADPETWSRCPGGAYELWFGSDGITSGMSTVALNGKQTERRPTLMGGLVRNRGRFTLGARRDGTAGDLSWKKAGAADIDLEGARLFRHAPNETSLSIITTAGTGSGPIIIDTPSRDRPRGGVWRGDVDITDRCSVWGYPLFSPPFTAIWFDSPASPLTVEYFARWQTYPVE